MFTQQEVINERKKELFNEIQQIEVELERLKVLKERRHIEYKMLENIEDRSIIITTTEQRVEVRKGVGDRLFVEDILREIFDNVGRPMKISEIIEMLKKYNKTWNSYHAAYQFVISTKMLEKTGKRGYYNIISTKW